MIASLIRYVSDEAGTDDAMRLSVARLLRELLRGATDAMNRVTVEWVPLLFVGKHEPRSQKEIADAPTTAQREEKGRLAKLFEESSDEAGIGPSALAVRSCLTDCL